ncbi:MAG: sulfotransferase [Ardenticatenaceae bacterium]|nr:sulfotransferase [Anaerolineales bacterium]MCB8922183.1 sulfotransferase [Ardenticatenaceae bacterium]
MSSQPTPIFIFSLPRSGSTLLQRLLAADAHIATVSESHLLLPFLYSLREQGVFSEYNHAFTAWAIQEFCRNLPGGTAAYLAEIRDMALRLYGRAAGENVTYFVDKAAAYHQIAEEVIQMFPEARVIFLWRNPLAVAASLMESWKNGRWNLFEHDVRLYEGVMQLTAVHEKYAAQVHALRYEDLLTQPEVEMERIFTYLQLPFERRILDTFAQVSLQGQTGDMVGMAQYHTLNREPLQKWKRTLANPLRKMWSGRYLRTLGSERLGQMGYSLDELLHELRGLPPSGQYLPSDLWRIPYGIAYRYLEGRVFSHKLKRIRAGQRVFAHK